MCKKLFKIMFAFMMMFMLANRVLAEEEYSDNFLKLTDETLKIRTDGELSTELVEDYVSRPNFFNMSFSVTSELSGENKIEISLSGQGITSEKHLVSVVKEDIDSSSFDDLDVLDTYNIPADPTTESSYYTGEYIGNPEKEHAGGGYGTISYLLLIDSSSAKTSFIVYEEYDSDYNYDIAKIQYKKVVVNYTGYDNENHSLRYINTIGKNMVIDADNIDEDDVIGKIGSWIPAPYDIIECEDDYSSCDIILETDIDDSVELHRVNITKNTTISPEFKKAFNLDANNKIKMIFDTDVNFEDYSINDVNNKRLKKYACTNTQCTLTLISEDGSFYEKRTIDVDKIGTTATEYYKNNIGLTKDFYYGVKEYYMFVIEESQFFGKNTKASECNDTNKTCKVSAINSDGVLETHVVTFALKDGKSPLFTSKVPSSIAFNAVYKNDYDYLDKISHAYMIRNGMYRGYMTDIDDTKATVNLENEMYPENQVVDVSYKDSDPEAEEVIEGILEDMGTEEITVLTEDLEYVNEFYYNYRGYFTNNYDSVSLNNVMKEYIDNIHVGYFFSSYMPSESRYFSASSGEVVLYYDGVAYGVSDQFKHLVNNIIYIPDDTAETTEAFINAAQKRIDNYLGDDSGVKIDYSGPYYAKLIDDKSDGSKFSNYNMDKSKFDGKEYSISYDGRVEYVLIYKDSSRMQTDTFFSSDINNNIVVKSSTASYPINTTVNSKIIDEESEKYKTIIEKIGVDKALVVDISLFSPTIGQIEEFNEEVFEVTIPITDSSLLTEDMCVYFIGANGKIETLKLEVRDDVYVFKPTHFSEYIIAENVIEEEVTNPQTSDNISNSLLFGTISLMGLLGICYCSKKKAFN